jgi:lipopolysaccharide export system permease protein
MAKQGVWPVWQGMWLSTFLLLSLGAFFTYKSVNDSVIINPDGWKMFLQKLTGKREVRIYSRKEVVMIPPDYEKDVYAMDQWEVTAKRYLTAHKRPDFYFSFWKNGFRDKELNHLAHSMEVWIEDLRNSEESLIIGKLMDYPVIRILHAGFLNRPAVRWVFAILFPAGLLIYWASISMQKRINNDLLQTIKVNEELKKELEKRGLICFKDNHGLQSICQ